MLQICHLIFVRAWRSNTIFPFSCSTILLSQERLQMKLVTVFQMQTIEKEADAGGLTYDQMMENAGQGLADIILSLYIEEGEGEVIGLVGAGNNGGDTLIALSALAAEGWKARAYLVKRKKDDLVKRFIEAGGEVLSKENSFEQLAEAIETADVFLDGISGTGIQLPLKKDVAEFFAEVNDVLDGLDEPPLIVAVDCPTGLDCDTGEVADETIVRPGTPCRQVRPRRRRRSCTET